MPLWQIYHPSGTFEDEPSRQALSRDVTSTYTRIGLPAFYVVVQFIHQPANKTYIGGQPKSEDATPFIRVVVDQIAVRHRSDDDEAYKQNRINISRVLKPHIADKGYEWEFHVDETERRLWQINGMNPPPFRSEEEKKWFDLNKPVEWSGAYDVGPESL